MPRELAPADTVSQEIRTYAQQKDAAKEKKHQKLGKEVIIGQLNEKVAWKVIKETQSEVKKDSEDLGLQGLDLDSFDNEVIGKIFFCIGLLVARIWSKRNKPLAEQ